MSKILAFLITAILSQSALAGRCAESKEIRQAIPAGSFNEIRLNALAGNLYIEAGDDDQIVIEGIACSDETEYLDRMRIDIDAKGKILEITVIIPYNDRDWYANYAHIDLTLAVPAAISNLIKDSSGDLEAYGVTLSRIEDSSGDIHLRDTFGNLNLRDSSGDFTVRGHTGNLMLEDSSGDIDVSEVDGEVVVKRDSSGDIEIEQVTGLVTIERDSSGDIEIEQVGQSVTVGSDGGGSIRIRDVRGSVEIGADGSGEVRVRTVEGDFRIVSKGAGDISTSGIKGNISIPDYN
ncbi:MAG: DUF4097 and DUF4098 domain-containing protein YvlB [Candidatus Azotimanducaceae bacterium]|jgi:DUF4097 and DUF4098 domain-containing protein YvlB